MSSRPPKATQRLDLLAVRVTRGLLSDATVHVRDCGPAGVKLWNTFDNAYRRRAGRDEVQAPHSVATTALRALTGGYVWLDAKRAVLASRDPIDDDTVRDVFTLLYGLATGEDIDDIDLNRPVSIADKFASTPRSSARWPTTCGPRRAGSQTPLTGYTRLSPGTSPAGSRPNRGRSTACRSGFAPTLRAASSHGTTRGRTRPRPGSPFHGSGCG